ncbi:MAG: ATP-dependent DNA helicase, partial [Myxococcota bacterium]
MTQKATPTAERESAGEMIERRQADVSERDEAIDAVLGRDGLLAAAIPHYEDRPEQRRMGAAVAAALADERPLLVEAGTGTGKTLAYLVPALLSQKRVVVATGTRTLQDQITRRDLPLLRDLMLVPFRAVTLKGVSNYICLRKWTEKIGRGVGPAGLLDLDDLSNVWDDLIEWVEYSDTGDRAEFEHLGEDAPLWAEITTTPERRLGPRCPFYERCFVTRARRSADKADLIVVNHHLFFADLALRTSHPGARVLPEYDAVIFDEAHQLEDVLTEHFGIRVSSGSLAQLVRDGQRALARPSGAPALQLSSPGRGQLSEVSRRIIDHVAQR